jgi:hypothetical protein
MCAALETVEDELPVVPDVTLARNAQILLEACHAAGVADWSIALALGLENSLVLTGMVPWHVVHVGVTGMCLHCRYCWLFHGNVCRQN